MSFNKNLKTVDVVFNDMVNITEPDLTFVKNAKKVTRPDLENYRSNDEFWQPVQFISKAIRGRDISNQSGSLTQLGMLGNNKQAFTDYHDFSYNESRDEETLRYRIKGMLDAVNEGINNYVYDTIANQGSIVVAQPNRITGWDDAALCEQQLLEQGMANNSTMRYLAVSPYAYVNFGGDLQSRQTMSGLPEKAYKDSYMPMIAGFGCLKFASSKMIRAAGSPTVTVSTLASAGNYNVPVAQIDGKNVDYRYSDITVSNGNVLSPGDAFTIANVFTVNRFSKQKQSSLKTFRVIAVNANKVTITPALISAQGGTKDELNYQNCIVESPSATAPIVLLNKNASVINPFWTDGALQFYPGYTGGPTESDGVYRTKATTSYGLEYMLQQWSTGANDTVYIKITAIMGANVIPDACGILIDKQLP